MSKEVGTSDQISLRKKYVGQRLDMTSRPDRSIVINAVRAVPVPTQSTQKWAQANAASIDQYNAWASAREPYSQRVRRWRAEGVES